MPRAKKDATPISIKMDQVTFDRLTTFCEQSGQPKTVAIERAVNMYIDRYDDMVNTYEKKETVKSQ